MNCCPTCNQSMTQMGCCITTGIPIHWCANCGTIKPCDQPAVTPAAFDAARAILPFVEEDFPDNGNPKEPRNSGFTVHTYYSAYVKLFSAVKGGAK